MNYSTSLCIVLFSFFIGIAAGSFVAIAAGKLFRRYYLKCRFSIACVAMSLSVAAFAAMLIFLPESHSLRFFTRNDMFFWFIVAVIGFLISVFWKFLLIPAFLIFLLIWIHTYYFLQSYFDSAHQRKIVSVQRTSLIINDQLFQTGEKPGRKILLKVYRLPERLVLPLPRFWIRYTVLSEDQLNEDDDYSKYFVEGDFTLSNKANMIQEWKQRFDYWLLGNTEYVVVPVPDSKNYPVLYSFTEKSGLDKLKVSLKRDL